MSQLHRLVYTSVRKCDDAEIEKILASCKKNNPGKGLTGVLLHSKNRFIQYLEGEKEEIQKLYDVVKVDPRHTSVNQRNFEPITKRVFPDWFMGYKDVESDEMKYHSNISEEDQKQLDDLIQGKNDFTDRGMTVLKLFFELS